jgi:hypothetical protein
MPASTENVDKEQLDILNLDFKGIDYDSVREYGDISETSEPNVILGTLQAALAWDVDEHGVVLAPKVASRGTNQANGAPGNNETPSHTDSSRAFQIDPLSVDLSLAVFPSAS